ncbi:hypothetical protein BHE74_00049402 [Ensete ventricosum]|nr:hypothetical protein GW17_00049221 [Ensete ventricosum]RWW44807.1 hypothetical protein BHE74_00049402 [Ensete ventricosum]
MYRSYRAVQVEIANLAPEYIDCENILSTIPVRGTETKEEINRINEKKKKKKKTKEGIKDDEQKFRFRRCGKGREDKWE